MAMAHRKDGAALRGTTFREGNDSHRTAPVARSAQSSRTLTIREHNAADDARPHHHEGPHHHHHEGGNRKSRDTHQSKLVRSFSLQALKSAFQDIRTETDTNRPISELEFRNHIMRTSPALASHTHDMFHALVQAGHNSKDEGHEDSLDFKQLMMALFPGSNECDLFDMAQRSERPPPSDKRAASGKGIEREAAKGVFLMWNTAKNGKLSYDEFKEGLQNLTLTEDEISDALEELYEPEEGNPRPEIDLEEFTHWYIHDGNYAL